MIRSENSPYRLVVFDCDGTLMDSQHMIIAAMETAFERAGRPKPSGRDVRRLVGISLYEAIEALAPDTDLEDRKAIRADYAAAFFAMRESGSHREPLYPGTAETLDRLAEAGYLIGLATGKSLKGVHHSLGQYGLLDYFATLQTADIGPGKPHPAMLERAMDEAGARPQETILVGDTTFDMEMSRTAGTAAIGVAWGYHETDELMAAGADIVIDRFDELDAAIAELARHDQVL